MSKDKSPSKNQKNIKPKGWQLIQEAVQLFNRLSFSTANGAIARGEKIHISVNPRWDKDSETFHLLISCLGLGHRQVDWEGMPVIIEPSAGTKAATFIARLDRRGQSMVKGLSAGSYGTLVSAIFSKKIIPLEVPVQSIDGQPEQLAAKDNQEQSNELYIPPAYTSNDSRVYVTPLQLSQGISAVEFETEFKELDGAIIQFFFLESSGKLIYKNKVVLVRVGEDELWGAYWEGKLETVEACELVFQVIEKG